MVLLTDFSQLKTLLFSAQYLVKQLSEWLSSPKSLDTLSQADIQVIQRQLLKLLEILGNIAEILLSNSQTAPQDPSIGLVQILSKAQSHSGNNPSPNNPPVLDPKIVRENVAVLLPLISPFIDHLVSWYRSTEMNT